jgi:hypothetical protein
MPFAFASARPRSGEARPGALHVAGDHHEVGRIAGEAVNCRGYHHVTGSENSHQLLELRPVGGRVGDLVPAVNSSPEVLAWLSFRAECAPNGTAGLRAPRGCRSVAGDWSITYRTRKACSRFGETAV